MTFRARLAPLVWAAVLTTFGVYVGIKFIPGLAGTGVADDAFGWAALAGLAHFAFLVATRHAREGLELDDTGLRDLATGTRLPWDDIQALFPDAWNAPAGAGAEVSQPGEDELAAHRANGEERAGIVGALFKVVAKGGAVVVKLLKVIKPGAVLLSLAAYSLVFSWQAAVGLMVMIGVHECGHVYAMWKEDVDVQGIYLVPFFGGAAVSRGIAGTRRGTAYIALNGPVWGTLLAIACLLAFFATGMAHPWLAAGAGWGALLNLFNLLPIYPLDGGRVVGSLAHATGRGVALVFGFLVFGAALAYVQDLQLLWLLIIIGLFELGPHVAATPYRAALDRIGDRPFGEDEAEHFDRLVARVVAGSTSEGEQKARRQRYGYRIEDARQTPMTGGQRLAVLGAYVGLFAVLLAITVVATKVPGSGVHLGILR